jgi:hypothetical protein
MYKYNLINMTSVCRKYKFNIKYSIEILSKIKSYLNHKHEMRRIFSFLKIVL